MNKRNMLLALGLQHVFAFSVAHRRHSGGKGSKIVFRICKIIEILLKQ